MMNSLQGAPTPPDASLARTAPAAPLSLVTAVPFVVNPAPGTRVVARRVPPRVDLRLIVPLATGVGSLAPAVMRGMFPQSIALLLVGLVFGGLMFAAVMFPDLSGLMKRRRARRQMERAPLRTFLTDADGGKYVRLGGVVAAGATFQSAGLQQTAVMASYKGVVNFGLSGFHWAPDCRETHGLDFELTLTAGRSVTVTLDGGAVHLGALSPRKVPRRSQPVRRVAGREKDATCRLMRESALRPGDRVEIAGVVDWVADPTAERLSSRGLPRRCVLSGTPGHPLVIRQLPG